MVITKYLYQYFGNIPLKETESNRREKRLFVFFNELSSSTRAPSDLLKLIVLEMTPKLRSLFILHLFPNKHQMDVVVVQDDFLQLILDDQLDHHHLLVIQVYYYYYVNLF